VDSVLEPLVPNSLREAEYFVQLDAKKLLTKSTLYDLGNERLKVFFDQAELNARYLAMAQCQKSIIKSILFHYHSF
jgi:hypothetical protein